ncbi:MAG: HEAT repeat domain-containing protein [Candidatus Poseidoniaceae archaeon]|jgi:deoxyhypusine monooxygenase|nr:HEAT repeat domain-containing protein [Candidatus Poseidoniaceae archaeon]
MRNEKRTPRVSEFGSVDPAPPLSIGDVESWRTTLLDDNKKMFEKMRVVFSLRNNRSPKAVMALCDGFRSNSALLRHEIAYVLGQMQDKLAIPTLIERLSDVSEHIMVRHEAAEALGAIGEQRAKIVLERFLTDPNPEVAESCEVALDLLELCANNEKIEW